MKPLAQLTFAAFAAVLFAPGRASASDSEIQSIDNHHGVLTYFYQPTQREAQKQTTIAFYSHGKGIGRKVGKVGRKQSRTEPATVPSDDIVRAPIK